MEEVTDKQVSFWYKDYRREAQRKLLSLAGVEFERRFLQHILPPGFAKIRYYGILSNRGRQERLTHIRELIGADHLIVSTIKELPPLPDVRLCSCCGRKSMVGIGIIPGGAIRAPPQPTLILNQAPVLN